MSQDNKHSRDANQSKTSRRDFIKTTAGALAGAGVLGLLPEISQNISQHQFGGIAHAGEAPNYEVYALKYGEMQSFPNILWYWMGNPPMQPNQPVTAKAAYYWLIKGPDTNILFDTGTTPEVAEAGHITHYEDHATVLGKLGLKIDDIDTVILSHSHADHMNGAQLFESNEDCRFYIHEACFKWSLETAPKYPLLQKLNLPSGKDIQWLAAQLKQKRLKLITGERGGKAVALRPGVSLRRVDGHMVGLQIAIVQTTKGPVVLTSDASYLYANMEMDWPMGLIMGNLTDAMDGLNTCKQSGSIHVPGHDMEVTKRFPEVKPGVYKIA